METIRDIILDAGTLFAIQENEVLAYAAYRKVIKGICGPENLYTIVFNAKLGTYEDVVPGTKEQMLSSHLEYKGMLLGVGDVDDPYTPYLPVFTLTFTDDVFGPDYFPTPDTVALFANEELKGVWDEFNLTLELKRKSVGSGG